MISETLPQFVLVRALALWRVAAVVALFAGLAPHASAVIALSIPESYSATTIDDYTVGWEFTLNSAIMVTDLGYLDAGNDGLEVSHVVGLWQVNEDNTGTLLVSAVVPSGTSGTLEDVFRFVSLATPVTLSAGNTYVIAGVSTGDLYGFSAAISTTSAVNYVGARSVESIGLSFPTTAISCLPSDADYFGGNFLYTPVPEPSSLALLGLAAVGGCLILRRKA